MGLVKLHEDFVIWVDDAITFLDSRAGEGTLDPYLWYAAP